MSELNLVLPARPQNVIVVRQAVAGLGEAIGVPPQRVNDLKTVVTEACNNVVLHAYEGAEEGPLEVSAFTSESRIEIEVRDRGRGFQPSSGMDDEPSLGLAPLIVRQVFGEIEALRASGGTILLVEQNARAALEIADRGYVLETGRIALSGTARALLDDPAVQDAYLGGQGSSSRAVEARIRARKAAILGSA